MTTQVSPQVGHQGAPSSVAMGVGDGPQGKPQQNIKNSPLPKASQELWEKFSENLVSQPDVHWQAALSNALELSNQLMGTTDEELRKDVFANFNLLEKTLLRLNIPATEETPNPKDNIIKKLMHCRSNAALSIEDYETLKKSSEENSSNQSNL